MHRVLVYRKKYLSRSETFIYQQLIGHRRVTPIVLTRHKPFNVDEFPYQPIYVRKRLAGLSHWLKQNKIKLLHARFGPAGLELLPFAERTGLPLLTSFHGFDVSKRVKQDSNYRRELKNLFSRGKAFTVVSDHMKRQLVRLGCPVKKITLIRSGVDLQKFSMQPQLPVVDGAYRLLSVGRLTEKKGMDTLIRAFARIRSDFPRATLCIVGDGVEKTKLQGLIKQLDLVGHVQLKGALPHHEVIREMVRCHLFALACQTAKNGDQEGIPNVLMEAMAIGRPVVSTYHAGIPELVEHGKTGFLAPEKSPRKLAAVIRQALDNQDQWPEIAARAREKVEQDHDIAVQRLKLEELYLRLIKKTR